MRERIRKWLGLPIVEDEIKTYAITSLRIGGGIAIYQGGGLPRVTIPDPTDYSDEIFALRTKIEALEKAYAEDPRRAELKAQEEKEKLNTGGFMTFSQRKRAAEAALRKKPKA